MNILLTFTGFHDPYSKGLIGNEEQPGPILSLLNAKAFDKIILFSTPKTEKITSDTEKAIRSLHPDVDIEIKELPLEDPTDYIGILRGLRKHFEKISNNTQDTKYFISVASGTPQMHACWVLLGSSGEIPAHILHMRPPRFVTKDRPIISDVDLTSPDFPIVRSNILNIEVADTSLDINTVVTQLGIVGDHPSITKALEIAATLAQSDVPMIILGETGTGKEVFAEFIHRISTRASERFVPINCAAIPENLVDVLIIAATNKDIGVAIKEGLFREDLYYRLHVGEIQLPPLRERRSDIPKTALHVLDRINATLKRHKRLSPGALTRLQDHSWPGNVRDLENVIERSARLSRNDILKADDLLISEHSLKKSFALIP